MSKPAVGRIVHYVVPTNGPDDDACRAAIITRVKEAPNVAHSGIVDLCVFESNGKKFVLDVPFVLAHRRIEGTWHWPERED